MPKKVELAVVVEAMDLQSDLATNYFDRDSGEVNMVGQDEWSIAEDGLDPGDCPDWQRPIVELARKIMNDDRGRFVSLPDTFEIHEYRMLESFASGYCDERVSEQLLDSIRGRGAFRRFKDAVFRLGIEDQWFEYRTRRFEELARDWCERNDIDVV